MGERAQHAAAPSAPAEGCFPVVDVARWEESRDEPMGSAVKEWRKPPADDPLLGAADMWLFKAVRVKPVHGQLRVFGEDWSEKVVAELAHSLGVPAARVELATLDGKRGVVSPSFVHSADERFTPGNELLVGRDPEYPVAQTGQVTGYTPHAVWEVLRWHAPPAGLPPHVATAFDAFVGYLLLDALVANTDRHHENWGVVEAPNDLVRLAPSYDHGTSLGFQEPEDSKRGMLEDPEALRTWAHRGRSRHFEGKPRLVELAVQAMGYASASAAAYWRGRLETLDRAIWTRILERVPEERMSQADRTFASALLRVNQERLLDAC